MTEKLELHAIFRGKVQGVGFRWTVVDHAEKYHLTGFTKNLADGSVEVIAQGTKNLLEQFVESVKNDPGIAKIESVSVQFQKPKEQFSAFRIMH